MDKVLKAYTNEAGTTIYRKVPMGKAPARVTVEGVVFEVGFGTPPTMRCDLWPKESAALACTPQEVPEFREEYKKHGVAITFRDDGMAVVDSKRAFEKAARFNGKTVC